MDQGVKLQFRGKYPPLQSDGELEWEEQDAPAVRAGEARPGHDADEPRVGGVRHVPPPRPPPPIRVRDGPEIRLRLGGRSAIVIINTTDINQKL